MWCLGFRPITGAFSVSPQVWIKIELLCCTICLPSKFKYQTVFAAFSAIITEHTSNHDPGFSFLLIGSCCQPYARCHSALSNKPFSLHKLTATPIFAKTDKCLFLKYYRFVNENCLIEYGKEFKRNTMNGIARKVYFLPWEVLGRFHSEINKNNY